MTKKLISDDSDAKWRQFEKAVASFLSTSGSSAKITHDKKQIDPDTGSIRQRDVWIEAILCELFPIKALVSCKRWANKLNAKDIEHFYGEYCGANVNLGILYSHAGFTKTAIKKANALGRGALHCCQLYVDQAPDIPEMVMLKECYCVKPRAHLALLNPPADVHFQTWRDVFDLGSKVVTEIQDAFRQMFEEAKTGVKGTGFPSAFECRLDLVDSRRDSRMVTLVLTLGWKIYQSNVKANRLNGTYSLTENRFLGTETTPVIDTWEPHPGPDWTLLKSTPTVPVQGIVTVFFSSLSDLDIESLSKMRVVLVSPDPTENDNGANLSN